MDGAATGADGTAKEVAKLRERVAQLEALVAQLAAMPEPVERAHGVVSRRNLMRLLPAAALTAAGSLSASPAAAADGAPLLLGKTNAAATTTGLYGELRVGESGGDVGDNYYPDSVSVKDGAITLVQRNDDDRAWLSAYHSDTTNIGSTDFSWSARAGLVINALTYVHGGASGGGDGIKVNVTEGVGLRSTAQPSQGPIDTPDNNGVAIDARAILTSSSITASSDAGPLFAGRQYDGKTKVDAVSLTTAGLGRVVFASTTNTANGAGTITGITKGTGPAVFATQDNQTATGPAIVGAGGAKGRGARLKGGAAAVQLQPSTASTHPTSGQAGDLVVDSTYRLWYCQGTTKWKQLA